jgi:hypothetical protein
MSPNSTEQSLVEKKISAQLLKKLQNFYATRRGVPCLQKRALRNIVCFVISTVMNAAQLSSLKNSGKMSQTKDYHIHKDKF